MLNVQSLDDRVSGAVLRAVREEEADPLPPISEAGGSGPQSVVGRVSPSPIGITGDKLTKGIDWGNWTFPSAAVFVVRSFFEQLLGPAEDSERGCNTYHAACRWASGAVLAWTDGRAECWLSLNAGSVALLPADDLQSIFKRIKLMGGRCTRLDCRVDVPRSRGLMDRVHEAVQVANVRGFRSVLPHRDWTMRVGGNVLKSDCVYFGRRGRDGSGRYVRIYDKLLESKGKLDVHRIEVELSGEVSGMVFEALCMVTDQVAFDRGIGEVTVGSIDFVDRAGAHGHVDRMPRLDWWQALVDEVGRSVVSVHRDRVPLERSVEWMVDVCSRKLALAFEVVESQGMDGNWFMQRFASVLLRMGRRKLDASGIGGAVFLGIDVHALFKRLEGVR